MPKKLFFYIKILLAILIFWSLAYNAQLNLNLFDTFFSNLVSTFIIISLVYVMILMHGWRWYRLNSAQSIKLTYAHTVMSIYLGLAFNTMLPGSLGGDFIRLYYVIKKCPQQKSRAILSILVDRIIGLMGILIIACLIAPFYFEESRHNHVLLYLITSCISICIGGIILLFAILLLLSKDGIYQLIVRKTGSSKTAKLLHALLEAILIYKKSKFILFEALIVSMLTQLMLLIAVMMLNKTMELPLLPLFDYMLALAIGQIANLIPLTPGGIGLGEAAFANVILIINPGTSAAYATVFFALRLLSTIAYLPGVLIGIFGLQLLDKKQAQAIAT